VLPLGDRKGSDECRIRVLREDNEGRRHPALADGRVLQWLAGCAGRSASGAAGLSRSRLSMQAARVNRSIGRPAKVMCWYARPGHRIRFDSAYEVQYR
jgi:hypothetical protein